MSNIFDISNSAAEINRLHEKAAKSAADAIGYAKEAGKLLLEAKEALPHGSFSTWIQYNLTVSHRQAQRYINAYKGKITQAKYLSKSDMMSDSEKEHFFNVLKKPQWIPQEGVWYTAGLDIGAFWVIPDSKFSNAFHISKFSAPPSVDKTKSDIEWIPNYECTKSSVDANKVEASLIFFGLINPHNVEWNTSIREGQPLPFGQFEYDDQ